MDGTDGGKRVQRRATFNQDAELYDRVRPGYPDELYADLTRLAGAGPGCRVLEIGCGTGQATAPLAELGCQVVAVELGAELAGVARRNLARFPGVEVVTAAFETWPLPREPFDVVLAATSWHWLDPAVRVGKAADALRPGGTLATVATHHVAGGTQEFFVEAERCYERWDPDTPPGGARLPAAADLPVDADGAGELDCSGRFGPAVFRRYERDRAYTTERYLDVLRTYSGHRAMSPADLDGLLGCIGQLIAARYGGRITKRYLTELRVARRLAA